MDNECGFFCWYDLPIYERSNKVISGFLKRIQELELRVEDEMHSEVHDFLDFVVSSGRMFVKDKANSRLSVDKRWKENFCWFFVGFLCLVIRSLAIIFCWKNVNVWKWISCVYPNVDSWLV